MKSANFNGIALIASVLMLNGCGLLTSTQKPPVIYNIHPGKVAMDANSEAGPKSVVVIVPKPELPSGFSTDRVALYVENGRRLDYFDQARWASTLDDVMQNFMIEAARQAYPEAVIDSPFLSLPGNYRLDVTVNDFQPVYKGDANDIPELYTSMTFTLTTLPGKSVVTQFTVSRERPALENNMTSIASGLEASFRDVLDEAFERMKTLR